MNTFFPEKMNIYGKRERGLNMNRLMPFLLTSLAIASIFSFFLAYSPSSFPITSKQALTSVENQPDDDSPSHAVPVKMIPPPKKEEECDLFKGQWVPDLRGPLYTNSSCKSIPESKNCFKNGRMDRDFLNWKWKPEKCELPEFDPKAFLQIVRGKKMAFVGDSVARNHVESLLCLLSQEELPKDIYKDSEDRFRTWYFPQHDFTLMKLWSKYLIAADERMVNGTGSGVFDLHIDRIDDEWAKHLPGLDYAIISDGHWFFRVLYLYKGKKLIGCVYCNQPNITGLNTSNAVRMAFRSAFKYISNCKNCKGGLLTLLRTFAPAHFENGAWNTGGYCNRTSPLREAQVDFTKFDWEMRKIQIEEIERARKEEKKIKVLDITRAMLMRPDGHPGLHWGNQWMKGYSDCVHWCMPGPVDYWNNFLMALIRN
ncbi:xyloglucan O-acetyltransferase 4 [Rosa rugosa]|uniref:xyloglucan O-acetyltransferase 4 n=1 Tax=Rosa rugosa TaxID=74645 RepID=UPI002B4184FA|nr:xyloglucan O-acetyltransferase 4 [Rosa rugosa]